MDLKNPLRFFEKSFQKLKRFLGFKIFAIVFLGLFVDNRLGIFIATRNTTTAVCRSLFLEKAIDISVEQAVVAELRPGLLPQLVGDHQGGRLRQRGLHTPLHVALYVGQHRRVVGRRGLRWNWRVLSRASRPRGVAA